MGGRSALLVVCSFVSPASAQWNEQVLYSFQNGLDGSLPTGAVVFDTAGNLYGVTQEGGAATCLSPYNCGTVYKLTPPTENGGAWTETVLYVFKGYAFADGATPQGGLVVDDTGNLYGTTGYGGSGPCLLLGGPVGCGTVYELSPPTHAGDAWTETVLYSFQGGTDGYVAFGDLVLDKARNLYGGTLFGGGKGTTCDSLYGGQCGTIFELSPPKQKGGQWTEKVLHRFAGVAEGAKFGDGASPNGGLVIDTTGNLYGTTFLGGYNCPHNSNQGCGTVFELSPPTSSKGAWDEKLVHVFMNKTDGTEPMGGVILGADGSLFGAANGGTEVSGVVFKLNLDGNGIWEESIVYAAGGEGFYYAPAVSGFDSRGNLYGTINVGPGLLDGSVFRLKPSATEHRAWILGLLYSFEVSSTGGYPNAELTSRNGDNLYGSTQQGGDGSACEFGCGTVFKLMP
jgi:uncharacterized repeat protein (TIGR03803 family)